MQNNIINATKWSTITELIAKIVTPVSNMILARILSPDAFGVVATATMIFSFADMFTDAGFQKYLVQHEFKDEDEKHQNANIAFWTNLGISFLIWGIVALFCEPIAAMVGNPGLGNVITIACMQLPLTSFTSIQMALYRRQFDFKTLFWARIVTISVPFAITIPFALTGFSYWSLIIGSICGQLSNAILLTLWSKWKPKFYYKIRILKEMISFSIWSLIEAISIWFTTWVDAFIIGNVLSQYYLGLYKTSTTMVNSLMALITASVVPVLFSALSRLQDDETAFKKMFFNVQRYVSIIVFPLGVGLFLYSDLATKLLLGSKWNEASGIIGVWALTSAIMIVCSFFCSEVYRAKGKPKLSFLAQLLHLVVLVPVCIICSNYGFWTLVYARAWIRMEAILVNFILMYFIIRISPISIFKNIFPTALSAAAMGFLGFFLQHSNHGIIWSLISIVICALFYYGMLHLFPGMKKEVHGISKKLKPKWMKDKSVANQS